MITIVEKENCCGCHACYTICPQRCVQMFADNEGFWYPAVDAKNCIDCGLCIEVCPILVKEINDRERHSAAFACINNDDTIRAKSSSGGLFSLLAENTINSEGIVFGAVFRDDLTVEHRYTETLDGLGKLRGSKYVQSKIGDSYQQVKIFLEHGKKVLFTGTPCQIAGLHSYLGKDYNNLISVDIICHGVPSPKVFKRYCIELENDYCAKIKLVNFRRKDCGWKQYSVGILFDNDTEQCQVVSKNIFMLGFLQDLYLRPSCYNCKFKTLNRQSDITIADFWGIGNLLPDYDDNMGTSLAFVNSSKGEAVFSSITKLMRFAEVDLKQAIVSNPSAIKSAAYNNYRDKFFKDLSNTNDTRKLIHKYIRVNFFAKLLHIISIFKQKIVSKK